jgi:hypothetical protein
VKRYLLAFLLLGFALAHPTVVFGELSSEPRTPQPGEPFMLTMTLHDPSQFPISDAYVFAEFYAPGAAIEGEGRRAVFEETETDGLYRTEASLPEEGVWTLKLRDQTYRFEETNARLEFAVAPDENPAMFEFIFPPTQTPVETLLTWLMWLVGLPLLVGLIVTVVVLTGGKKEAKAGESGAGGS